MASVILLEAGSAGKPVADCSEWIGDLVREHEPANWRQMVERCHVVSGEVECLYELAGISGDDDVPDQLVRPDLAKLVIWNWIKDQEATNQPRA